MQRTPFSPLGEQRGIPSLVRMPLIQRLISLPRWTLVFAAVIAIPVTISPIAGLARFTTTGPSFCLSCHGTGETPDRAVRSLVHPTFDQVTCVDCHAKTGQLVFEGYVGGFLAEPDRVTQNCIRCHSTMTKTDDQSDFKVNFRDIRITHRSHLERGASCTTCHANVAHDLNVPQTNRPTMQACFSCHATNDNCAKCHTDGVPAALSVVPAPGTDGMQVDGRAYYLRTCSACHGPTGDAIRKIDLSKQDVLDKLGEAAILEAVAKGHGQMPPFGVRYGGTMSDDAIRAAIGYLQAEAVGTGQPDGKALYTRTCIVCHGESGDKVAAVQHSSTAFWELHGDAELLGSISRGKGGMPPIGKGDGGPLSNQEINTVIAYLKQKTGAVPIKAALGPDGAALYAQNCAGCHGAEGKQMPSANLANKEFVAGLGDDKLTVSVAAGIGGMPAFESGKGGKLSSADIGAVVQFVRGLAGLPMAASAVTQGPDAAGLYKQSCAACHGADGKQLPSANLASMDLLTKRGDEQLAKAIAEGKGGMPGLGQAKGGKLSDADVKAIVAYLKTLVSS